jgi:hypothetical protein
MTPSDPAGGFVRLAADSGIPPFTLPAAAWQAVEAVAVAAASWPFTFGQRPAAGEESVVLAVFLTAVMDGDPGTDGDRTELLRGCPDFFINGSGRALVGWLHESHGFRVDGAPGVPVPSVN